MDIADAIKAGDAISEKHDFSKMCEGVSYAKAELRVEQYGARFVMVSGDAMPEITKDQLCALKSRVGLDYCRSDVLGGETTAFVYETKASLNGVSGIISSIPVGWKDGENVIELRGLGIKLLGTSGIFNITNLNVMGTGLSMNTTITTALGPWPVRCPS